jgi:excisionase family DNA binding protein
LDERLLRTLEVAELFGVSGKTIWQWAEQGRLEYIRTPGGHRRYRETQVRNLLAAGFNPVITQENGELYV